MLSDITVERTVIRIGKQEFSVSGITFEMVAQLVAKGNRAELGVAIEKLETIYHAAKDGKTDIEGSLVEVIALLPQLTAKVIALASDEPDQWPKVLKFSISTQLEALLAMGRLTFEGEDSIKNFVSGLLSMMVGLKNTLTSTTEQIALTGSIS